MTEALTLYDAPGSPCARRVRITLIEKGLPYDTVFVDLSKLERVEDRLAANEFLVGTAVSVADIAFFSRIEMYSRLGMPIETDRFPSICRDG